MTINVPSAYDELVQYLASKATPQEILAFEVSPVAQARAEDLIERSSAGTITPQEAVELEQMLHFDGIVSMLKARALAEMKRS